MVEFISYVYRINSRPSAANYGLCVKYANISAFIVKLWLTMYLSNVSLYEVAALYEYLISGTSKPMLNMYLPFVDGGGALGMTFIYLMNIFVALTACIVLYAFDALISIVFTNIPMLSTIIIRKWSDMEDLYKNGQINRVEHSERFNQLLLMHLKYNE